jgi:hypothetical protein
MLIPAVPDCETPEPDRRRIMAAGFLSPKDEAKANLEKAKAEYKKVDDEYIAYKRTHALPLDTSDPEVISLQRRRNEAGTVLEDATSKYKQFN